MGHEVAKQSYNQYIVFAKVVLNKQSHLNL